MSGELSFYCKAYLVGDLKRFSHFHDDLVLDRGADDLSDEDVVFIHPDYRVSRDVFAPEPGSPPSQEWVSFCVNELGFRIPDDLRDFAENDQTSV